MKNICRITISPRERMPPLSPTLWLRAPSARMPASGLPQTARKSTIFSRTPCRGSKVSQSTAGSWPDGSPRRHRPFSQKTGCFSWPLPRQIRFPSLKKLPSTALAPCRIVRGRQTASPVSLLSASPFLRAADRNRLRPTSFLPLLCARLCLWTLPHRRSG